MIVDNLIDGQKLWYCKFDLYEVEYVKSPYKDKKVLARFPPNDVRCFTELKFLHPSRREAINSIIKRIETMEGRLLSEYQTEETINDSQFMHLMNFFDTDKKNLAFNQLISSINDRINRLEQNQTKSIKNKK